MNYIVYSLEKFKKRRKIILSMNGYYSNHLIRQEKFRFILHLYIYVGSGIRDDKKRPDPDPQH
jgi:hypothetical protein